MKLSTLAAQAVPAKRPRLGEIGAVGTTFSSGFTAGVEHNADLTGARGLDVWERMFRADGTGRAVELAYTLPIAGANMAVEPPTTKGRAKEMAEAAERMLRTMAISWEQTLRAQLFYLRYGYYLFEKVWAYRDGRYVLDRLAPRPPRTLYRWYLTEAGDMDGAQFRVWKPTAHGFGTIPVGSHQYIDIPRDKLLHLVNGQEAGNFTGESLGRAMYKAWKMKETLELITMIGVEKREIGTEAAFMGPKANEDDARDMATALASLHANAKGYLIVPDKEIVERLEIFGTGGTRGNATTLIEYHKREMALSGLAGFLTLGDGGGGSYAQSRDKTSLFLIALKAVADYLADVNTREIIHPFCRYNWPGVRDDELPRMTFSGLDTRNMQQFAAMIVQLVAGGILAPDAVVRAAVRADLDLPEEAKNITAIMDQKAGLVEPPEPTEPEPEPVEEDEEEELEPLPEDEALEDVPPDNLLLTLDDVPVGYAEYAQVDPSRYEVTPDGTSKLGYKVIDKQTGRRLTGYAAIKVKEALDKLAARGAKGGKGSAAKGAAKGKAEGAKAGGKGPDPAQEAEKAARKAEADRRRADADERRKKLDERRDKMDTERAKRQEAADKRREEADRRREDAAAKRESDRAKREQDAGRREADKQQRATDKATIDAAKSERDGLAADVAKLDPKAAAEKLKSAGWEPAGGGADAASAAVEARKVAAANPDKIVTVVKTKTGSVVVTKPKKSFAGGKGENQLSRQYAAGQQPTGVIVALVPPADVAEQIALLGDEPVEEMHLTVAFLGRTDADMTPERIADAKTALGAFSLRAHAVRATLSGTGRFSGAGDEGDPMYVSVDAPSLPRWRQALIEALDVVGLEVSTTHGFTPHITFAYVDPESEPSLSRFDPVDVTFGSVWLWAGGERTEYPLQPLTGTYAEDDEGESFEVDTGIGDDLDTRLAGAAERIAGYLFVDRGEGEEEDE